MRQSFEYSDGSAASAASVTAALGAKAKQTSAKSAMKRGRSGAVRFIVNSIQGFGSSGAPSLTVTIVYYSSVPLYLKARGAPLGCLENKAQLYKRTGSKTHKLYVILCLIVALKAIGRCALKEASPDWKSPKAIGYSSPRPLRRRGALRHSGQGSTAPVVSTVGAAAPCGTIHS